MSLTWGKKKGFNNGLSIRSVGDHRHTVTIELPIGPAPLFPIFYRKPGQYFTLRSTPTHIEAPTKAPGFRGPRKRKHTLTSANKPGWQTHKAVQLGAANDFLAEQVEALEEVLVRVLVAQPRLHLLKEHQLLLEVRICAQKGVIFQSCGVLSLGKHLEC